MTFLSQLKKSIMCTKHLCVRCKSKCKSVIKTRNEISTLKMQNLLYAFTPTIILHSNDFSKKSFSIFSIKEQNSYQYNHYEEITFATFNDCKELHNIHS